MIEIQLQALDCDDLFGRVKLAAYALREIKREIEPKIALLGIECSRYNGNGTRLIENVLHLT